MHLVWLLRQLRDPILGVLAGAVVAGYAYAVALAVFTPQNEGDPLVYELPRAALWRQEHGIGLTGADFDPRLDANPVVAEVGELATMVAGGTERFVALGQLSAVAALALGAYCLGRYLGLGGRPALFGALVVPTLPVITLQSWTGGNDLVVASFVVAAAVFVLGTRQVELGFATLAVALAVGTKFTGPLALPLLAIIAFVAPRRRRLGALLALLMGTLLGSVWYVANLVRTGDLDGGLADRFGQGAPGGIGNTAQATMQLVLDSIDASGAIDLYAIAYTAVGLALALAFVVVRAPPRMYLAAILVGIAPRAADAVGGAVAWVLTEAWQRVGNPETAELFSGWTLPTASNAYTSWYGPLVPAMVVGLSVFTIVEHRRGRLPGSSIVFALAPIVMLLVLASSLAYDESRGRFFAGAIVISCGAWGVILRVRWLAAGIAATCVVTLGLVLVNAMAKPTGIQAGEYAFSAPVWTLQRWEAQTLLRPSEPERDEASTVAFVDAQLPSDAELALELRSNDLLFPYFGPKLEHRVVLLDPEDTAPGDASWLVAAPGRSPRACSAAWRLVHERRGWRIWKRGHADTCTAVAPL